MPDNDDLFRSGSILTTRERLCRLAATPEPARLYAQPTRAEKISQICLVAAAVAVCASIGLAVIAAIPTASTRREPESVENPGLSPVLFSPPPPAAVRPPLLTATAPLRWEDLTLMLRTGLRDDEIIVEAQRKQLVVSIDLAREQTLRAMGAGDRLLGYLRAQHVYAAPAASEAERVMVTAQPVGETVGAPRRVYQPAPVATLDDVARDRQVESLKVKIETFDEQMRCIRTNPKDRRYWYHYYGRSNGIDQQKLDAYLNDLDRQRNDLRRQKWQLEGR